MHWPGWAVWNRNHSSRAPWWSHGCIASAHIRPPRNGPLYSAYARSPDHEGIDLFAFADGLGWAGAMLEGPGTSRTALSAFPESPSLPTARLGTSVPVCRSMGRKPNAVKGILVPVPRSQLLRARVGWALEGRGVWLCFHNSSKDKAHSLPSGHRRVKGGGAEGWGHSVWCGMGDPR